MTIHARLCRAWFLGRVVKSHPAFNLHTFRPYLTGLPGVETLLFKQAQQGGNSAKRYIILNEGKKTSHRRLQRVTRVIKCPVFHGEQELEKSRPFSSGTSPVNKMTGLYQRFYV